MSKRWGALLLLASLTASANEVFAPSDIPLLDNRVRIDADVKEITFIVKRKPETPSVILIRPDGSKLYVGKVTPPGVGWLALPEYDLITLRDPMPGPWQAVGEVDPENRVRLLSDIRLDYDPLPLQLYQGEVIKLTSRLFINGAPPTSEYYLADLGMTVTLQPLGDRHKEPLPEEALGHYLDDGKGLDERPADGVMTAETVLELPAGKYRAIFRTGNEVFVRAKSQEVLLYPQPVTYTLSPPSGELGAKLSLLVDRDELDPASVIIKGDVFNQTGMHYPFSVVATEPKVEVDLSYVKEAGHYTVTTMLYGTTRLGREVKITLPTRSFNIIALPVEPPSAAQPTVSSAEPAHAAVKEESNGGLVWMIAGGSVLFALLGAVGFMILQKRRALKRALAVQAESTKGEQPVAKLDLNLPEQ